MQIEKITQDLLPSEDLASTKSSSLLSPEQVSVSDMSKLPEAVYPVIGKYLDTPDAASFSQTAKAFTAIKPEKVILYGNDDVAAWQAKLKTIQDNGLLTRVRLLRIENATADQLTALIPCIDFPALEILDLSGCHHKALTDASIIAIADKCPALTHLNVSGSSELTDASIKAIAQKCTGLTHLNVHWCDRLTDSSIIAIAKHCKYLTDLDVSRCENLTDSSIIDIAKHCKYLTDLDVSRCKNLTDASIKAIAEHCKGLTHLNVSVCNKLTDDSIKAIAEHCTNLTHLSVRGCKKLTDDSIKAIAQSCKGLTHLDVSHCWGLTDDSITKIKNNHSDINIICERVDSYKTPTNQNKEPIVIVILAIIAIKLTIYLLPLISSFVSKVAAMKIHALAFAGVSATSGLLYGAILVLAVIACGVLAYKAYKSCSSTIPSGEDSATDPQISQGLVSTGTPETTTEAPSSSGMPPAPAEEAPAAAKI